MQKAIVFGAGGFIGHHMVNRLVGENYHVVGVDLKVPEFEESKADDFVIGDLRDVKVCAAVLKTHSDVNEIYQFAADMGGAGFVFTGDHDADILHNSATINLNILSSMVTLGLQESSKIFYSSSACIYPERNQMDPSNPICSEDSAYPADPDSEYGWEKLFSERLYQAYAKNYGLKIRVARYHNIYGPLGTWQGGREKAPAAICRKVAYAKNGDSIEVWGDGTQTRSFLYIDECIEATRRLMESEFSGPINIGSEEIVTINQLVRTVSEISGKSLGIEYVLNAPRGVAGRNSDNRLIRRELNWDYSISLHDGLDKTYTWISNQIGNMK